jgi:hypothetical protein
MLLPPDALDCGVYTEHTRIDSTRVDCYISSLQSAHAAVVKLVDTLA